MIWFLCCGPEVMMKKVVKCVKRKKKCQYTYLWKNIWFWNEGACLGCNFVKQKMAIKELLQKKGPVFLGGWIGGIKWR